jgi:DNA-binding SARP family transcriptional activator/class 3 adenylate cyclase
MASPSTKQSVGVRTFLIADVRGYTHFTLEQGDEAAARLAARFADVVEETVRHHGGDVLELRGDEALASFHSPRGALRAALDVQARFALEREQTASLPLLVGIGLDAGEAVPVKGGFRGGALNLAARLCSLAAAGEVLASEGVIHLARKTEGIRYVDRGGVQLKGFAEPVRVVRILRETDVLETESGQESMKGFQLRVMGGFQLTHDGTELATITWQPRARTLFTLVATSPQMRRSRDEVIDLLWPDASPDAGASNLRYTVHLLRRALRETVPTPLLTQGGWVQLNPAHHWNVDLHRFETLAGQRDNSTALAEAAAMYGGEPLPEYRYEDWATPVRDRIQRLWRDLCLRLAQTEQDGGHLESAARWYERLIETDPLDEETLQRLLPLLARAGRQTDALRIYSHFAAQLRQQLDLEPAPETIALIDEFRAERAERAERTREVAPLAVAVPAPPSRSVDVRPTYPLPAPGRIVGRDGELSRIESWLPGNSPGSSLRLVLVSAEAGMGKTRLLAEVAEMAYGRDLLVLAGGCYEEEGRLPWGPLHDALLDYVRVQPENLLRRQLGDLLPSLAQIVPELRARLHDIPDSAGGDAEAQRLRLFSTVAQVLERIADEKPLVLILDDLHWADDVTLQILHFLVRQPGLDNVRILGAYRSDEVARGTPLEGLQIRAGAGGPVELVNVQPLSGDDLAMLLEDRLAGQCAEDLVHGLHHRSAGNPFFALQMARLLEQEGRLQRDEGRWELIPDTKIDLPPAVRETVGRRLRHLDSEVRTILGLGAVLGREFDYAPLEAMSDGGEDSIFDSLDQAQAAGLIREAGEGYAFVHPLLWEVIYGRIPDQRRRRLHDRAGRSLEELYGASAAERPGELAWHFVEAGNRERGLLYALQAGKRAEGSIAHAEAERYFRQATDLARALGDQERLAQALEGLGGVLKAEARLQEAIERLDEAAQIQEALGDLDAEARVVAQLGLTWYFAYEGTVAEHARRVQDTMRRVETRDGDRPSLALAQLAAVLPRLLMREPTEELLAARRAAELGHELHEQSLEAAGFLRQGTALLGLMRYEEALDALSRSVVLAEQAGDLFTLAAANNYAASAASRLGRGKPSVEFSRRAFNAAEARGGLEQLVGIAGGACVRAFVAGEWDLAREFVERELALHLSLGVKDVSPIPYLDLAELNLHRGEWEDAEQNLSRAESLTGMARFGEFRVRMLRTESALLRGRVREAVDHLGTAQAVPSTPDRWVSDLEIPRALVLAAAGDQAAELAARAALRDATERRHAVSRIEALHALGVALRASGKHSDALGVLQEASALAGAYPYPYREGLALYEWGRSLGDMGQMEEARERFEDALPLFRRLGARPYIERTEAALTESQ